MSATDRETGPPGASWQRADVAASFLERRRRVLPMLDVQEDMLVRVLRRGDAALGRFLDLGSGDGALAELLLGEWPQAQAVLLDNSPPMLERAHSRLARFGERWSAVRGDLSDPSWVEQLDGGPYGAVVSSLAIHHLERVDKQRLFTDVLALLEPGGMFVTIDYVSVAGPLAGIFEEQMANNFLHSERERGGTRPEREIAEELSLAFDHDEEDRPEAAEQQVLWLKEIGFEQADIHFKWGEVAVFGATKPGIESRPTPSREP
jgi:tRNA (cmo5U34)-methyltransferase